MRGRRVLVPAGLAGVCAVVAGGPSVFAQCSPHNGNNGTQCCQPGGPDVIVGDMPTPAFNAAAQNINGVWYDAFGWATTSCNIGNVNVMWNAFPSNTHPCIGMNLFKYKADRFEQIGQSWLKHGFTALTQNTCGCTCSGQGGSVLGIGCSDPYTASRNAGQSGAGPKYQVNASTGFFPTVGPANPPWSGTTARRCKVKSADLEPSSATVFYYAEAQYVTQDDATSGNKDNNTTYRSITLTGGPNEFSASMSGTAQREQAGIRAWKDKDASVTETEIQTGDGLLILSCKVSDLGGGVWHYEYALQNVNSDMSVQAFSVPYAGTLNVTNIGFHDVDYNDFDGIPDGATPRNYDGTDWPGMANPGSVDWATTPFATNANANALRWGTLYNFRFDANRAPQSGNISIGTYKIVSSLSAATLVPGPAPVCLPDIAPAGGNGQVDIDDLLAVINNWGNPGGLGDVNGDNDVNVDDLLAVINAWGACP